VRRAAELKSKHAIAYADAFVVATAVECNAILLTGHPEIEALESEQNLKVEWLPKRPDVRSGRAHENRGSITEVPAAPGRGRGARTETHRLRRIAPLPRS